MGGGPFIGSRRQAPGEPPERAGSGRSSTSTIGIPAAGGLRLAAAGHSQIVLRQSHGLSRLAHRDPCNSRMLRYPPASCHKSHRGNCRPAPAGKSSSKHTPMRASQPLSTEIPVPLSAKTARTKIAFCFDLMSKSYSSDTGQVTEVDRVLQRGPTIIGVELPRHVIR